jgi:cobalt/nickel transport system permease protein
MTARMRFGAFLAAGIALAVVLALLISPHASSEPDGLGRVAIDEGFERAEEPHALADLPTAGYAIRSVDDHGLSTGLAGLLGVAATFAITGGLFLLLRRSAAATRRQAPDEA